MAVISRGLEGIIAAETRIGDVRGDIGQLIYCGYDINELAGKVSYEEVVHLLWHNRLPTARELDKLTTALRAHRHHAHRRLDARLLSHHAARSRAAGAKPDRHQARRADRRRRRLLPPRP